MQSQFAFNTILSILSFSLDCAALANINDLIDKSFFAIVQLCACGVKQPTLFVSSATAVNYCFHAEDGEAEVTVGDGAVLVFNEDGAAGCDEFTK